MKKIFVICVCVLLIATMFGASFSVLAGKGGGGGGKPPKDEDPDPTPANPAIAYRGGSGDNSGLMVMDADGSHQTHVPFPDGVGFYGHCWSPDGKSITFTSGVMNEHIMYLWRIDITVDAEGKVQGSNLQQLLSMNIRPSRPVWSPNGDVIAFFGIYNAEIGRSYSIWLYHVADGTTEKIYTDPDEIIVGGDLLSLTWDPTGTKLAFVKDTRTIDSIRYPPEIRIVDIFTKTVDTIYTFPDNIFPSYYPGGLDWANNDDKLAFNLAIWDNYHIAIYDISESSITTLSGIASGGTYSWSPDDSKISYTYYDQGAKGKRPKYYINTIDVSTQETVTLGAGNLADWCIV